MDKVEQNLRESANILKKMLEESQRLREDALKNWTDCMEAINKYCYDTCKNHDSHCSNDTCPLKEHRT